MTDGASEDPQRTTPAGPDSHALPIQDAVMNSASVPVFNCIVYVSTEAGKVTARVGNLEGIQVTGSSEREVLSKIVPEFKRQVAELHGKSTIPWVERPAAIKSNEVQRLIPVHL